MKPVHLKRWFFFFQYFQRVAPESRQCRRSCREAERRASARAPSSHHGRLGASSHPLRAEAEAPAARHFSTALLSQLGGAWRPGPPKVRDRAKIMLKIQAATLGCGSPTGIPSFATSQLKTFFNLLHFSE